MTNSRSVADLLLERAEIVNSLVGMAADSDERIAAATRLREIHADPAVARILEKAMSATPPTEVAEWVPTPPEVGEQVVRWPAGHGVTKQQPMLDAAFDLVLDAVRHRPDEVGAAVGRLSAEHGPDRINRVLDAVERRLRCRLPLAVRDAASAIKYHGHA